MPRVRSPTGILPCSGGWGMTYLLTRCLLVVIVRSSRRTRNGQISCHLARVRTAPGIVRAAPGVARCAFSSLTFSNEARLASPLRLNLPACRGRPSRSTYRARKYPVRAPRFDSGLLASCRASPLGFLCAPFVPTSVDLPMCTHILLNVLGVKPQLADDSVRHYLAALHQPVDRVHMHVEIRRERMTGEQWHLLGHPNGDVRGHLCRRART